MYQGEPRGCAWILACLFFCRVWCVVGGNDINSVFIDRLQQTLDYMEKGLAASGGPWLMGESLTLADYCIAPTIDRMNDLGLSAAWDDHPLVSAWFEDVRKRPAYASTYYKRTRLSEIYEGASYGADDNPATIVAESDRTEAEQA